MLAGNKCSFRDLLPQPRLCWYDVAAVVKSHLWVLRSFWIYRAYINTHRYSSQGRHDVACLHVKSELIEGEQRFELVCPCPGQGVSTGYGMQIMYRLTAAVNVFKMVVKAHAMPLCLPRCIQQQHLINVYRIMSCYTTTS